MTPLLAVVHGAGLVVPLILFVGPTAVFALFGEWRRNKGTR